MKPLLLVVTLLAAHACLYSPPASPGLSGPLLHIDPRFSEVEMAAVREGAAHWCQAADTPAACVTFEGRATWPAPAWNDINELTITEFGPVPTIWRVDEDDAFYKETRGTQRASTAGLAARGTIILLTPRLISHDDWVRISIHELGHVLGLDDGEGDVMNMAVACVDRDSLNVLCSNHIKCGPKSAPTCTDGNKP